jgi:hypothetical protein
MAFTQTQFLLDNCFNKTTEGENTNYTPIMIQMVFTKNTPADPTKIQLQRYPLIQFFNLPF